MAYKVGDKVVVKSRWDSGCNEDSYQCTFLREMLTKYGGTIAIITEVFELAPNSAWKIPCDGYSYRINGDKTYVWTSAMFENPKSSKEFSKITIKIKKHPIKLNYSL